MGTGRIRIGTSGWQYPHWRGGLFYPDNCDFAYYASQFSTVEINNTFYKFPAPGTVDSWRENSPADFRFSLKANRSITHVHYLKDFRVTSAFLDVARRLGEKLSVVLLQLPPRWHLNFKRFSTFCSLLPNDLRYTVEFRNPEWICEDILGVLRTLNIAFCVYDFNHYLTDPIITADFVYVRLHGPDGKYVGTYSDEFLLTWAKQIRAWSDCGLDVFVYFDNDWRAMAPFDAARLRRLVGQND